MAGQGMEGDSDVDENKARLREMEESSSDDDSEGDIYEVERVVGVTKTNGKTMYKVRWRGYGPSWDTWEPYENLQACVDMIEAYLERQKQLKLKKKEHSKKKREQTLSTGSLESAEKSEQKKEASAVSAAATAAAAAAKVKKPTYYYVPGTSAESDTLKDKFWRNLEEGKVDVFACGDLYTRVKGTGRSARPTSFKEDGSAETGGGKTSPTLSAERPRKKRVKTSDSKSELSDSGSLSKSIVRNRRKKGKKHARKQLDGASVKSSGSLMSHDRRESNTSSTGDVIDAQRRLSESSGSLATDSNSRVDYDVDMQSVASSSDTLASSILLDDHSTHSNDSHSDSRGPYLVTTEPPGGDTGQLQPASHPSAADHDASTAAEYDQQVASRLSQSDVSADTEHQEQTVAPPLCEQMDVTHKSSIACDNVNNNLFSMETRNEDDGHCEFELDDFDSTDWQKKEAERRLLNDVLELSNAEFRAAVRDGDYDRVRRALKSKRQYNLDHADNLGLTLVMTAAQNGYDDILELLILSGANVNAQQKNGSTALMHACEQGHLCTAALLLELGAYMNLQQNSGESALMKAVKRGHRQIVRLLLENGVNFATRSHSENTALKIARLHNLSDTQNLINEHISRLTAAFESQVCVTLNNTARILCALFPMQCFSLNEAEKFHISFKHELQPTIPGVGMLLFIAHARINSHEARCRFYGPCAVTSAVLNGLPQAPLTEEANFVLSLSPLHNGKNDLEINVVRAPNSKAKLVVCAYKAQLTIPPD